MDLGKTISFNSLTVNGALSPVAGGAPMSGYRVDELNFSNVDVAQKIDKRAIADGVDAQDVYLGARHINGIVSVFGSTQGDFWDKTQDLLAAFSPTLAYSSNTAALGFLPLDFYQPTADIATWPTSAYSNGIPLRFYCRPFAPPSYDVDRNLDGGTSAKGLSKRFRISLILRQPWKVTQAINTVSGAAWTTTGDYPVYPYVSISATTSTGTWIGTMNGSTWTVNVDGSRLTQAQLATRSKWVLDCYNQILYGPSTTAVGSNLVDPESGGYYSSLVSRMDRLASGSAFPSLSPGANTGSTGGSLSPTMTAKWRDAFA